MTKERKSHFGLATTFTASDVRAVLDLHKLVLRGGDARQVAASAGVVKVIRKFQLMEAKQRAHEAQKGNGTSCVTS
jgi:hypothetical protein